MFSFSIQPRRLPVIGPEDILVPTIGNQSQFPSGLAVLGETNINLTLLTNASILSNLTVQAGEEDDINVPTIINGQFDIWVTEEGEDVITEDGDDWVTEGLDWIIGGLTVQLAPPDGFIYTPALVNSSTFSNLEVALAPPDGFIYTPAFVNASVMSNLTVALDTTNYGGDETAGDFTAGDDG